MNLLFLFFYRDVTVQFLLDNLIKSALRVERGLSVIEKRLMDEYEVRSELTSFVPFLWLI